MRTTIDLVYFNAGGGHRAATRALEAVIQQQRRPWLVRPVNVMSILDPHERFRRLTGMAPEDIYNKRLASGFTLGLAQELRVFQGMLRMAHRPLVARLRRHWAQARPDMVVSLIPNFNRALFASVSAALPGVPYVTVLTDLADYPRNFWIEPGQRQWYVCGSDKAIAQARAMGCGGEQLYRTSGMILRPDFHEPLPVDVPAERLALGLDPQRPTGIVLFGGHGSAAMLSIARQLADVQLIFLCGHNADLAARLRRLRTDAPRLVLEFTPHVRRYMQLADFFIGKPGPGSLSEAVHLGLPVVTVRNSWTMPQERYNTEWVQEHGLGLVASSMSDLRDPVQWLLQDLELFRANVRRMPPNRAVFEVPGILADILAGQSADLDCAPAPEVGAPA